jgi:predicted membrane-bound mannosyltransferase
MLSGAIRLFVLVVLALAAISVAFFVLHLVLRLAILAAIVIAAVVIIRGWNRGSRRE